MKSSIASYLFLLVGVLQQWAVQGFVTPSNAKQQPFVGTDSAPFSQPRQPRKNSVTLAASGYVRPEDSEGGATTATKKSVHPKIGDLVRYYDLDGGIDKGEELVGKITFLTKTSTGWLAELTELEDVGDGYYAEYSSSKRMSKKTDRALEKVSPVAGSFVRSEQAYKVPVMADGRPRVRQEMYDLDDFKGPQMAPVDPEVVAQDGIVYGELKGKLLKSAALAGLAGAVVANILKGPEDAIIYFAGALASVGYLFFLSVKTDTLASPDRKLGSNVSNLRFLMPVFVIVGVALYNKSLGDANPVQDGNALNTITPEQFAAAVLGFLTYRIPLFLGQVQEALKEFSADEEGEGRGNVLPGSAGVALKLAQSAASSGSDSGSGISAQELVPVLLVSGPQATGRADLVNALLKTDDRFVAPKMIDKLQDGVTYERLQGRDELVLDDGRFGLTKDAILTAAGQDQAVVVNANVDLAKRLQAGLAGARLIGVWVGLNSVSEFETRILESIDDGRVPIPPDETRDSVLRARIKDIVNEIDYGLSSGIFEFTILNEDTEKSLKELKEAAGYCFK